MEDSTVFLGMTLDSKLQWGTLIDTLAGSITSLSTSVKRREYSVVVAARSWYPEARRGGTTRHTLAATELRPLRLSTRTPDLTSHILTPNPKLGRSYRALGLVRFNAPPKPRVPLPPAAASLHVSRSAFGIATPILPRSVALGRYIGDKIEKKEKKIFGYKGAELGDVSLLRRMPNVEVLAFSINKIRTLVDFAGCRRLRELYVRKNEIRDLAEIRHLRRLPDLTSLWLDENPCTAHPEYRMTVLKNLPNLEKLDNVVVHPEEVQEAVRKGAHIPDSDDEGYPQQQESFSQYRRQRSCDSSPERDEPCRALRHDQVTATHGRHADLQRSVWYYSLDNLCSLLYREVIKCDMLVFSPEHGAGERSQFDMSVYLI
ncbi:jg10303 [Pararge aegeria aegeria]|uniref:Jg10303 protein n=1 Tax=Pararge aegeria aegeria TaxID=348720 RepID=A0A8S4RYU7_9NEOP|nr:jg10303 [Pararge aegeria aegeria]